MSKPEKAMRSALDCFNCKRVGHEKGGRGRGNAHHSFFQTLSKSSLTFQHDPKLKYAPWCHVTRYATQLSLIISAN